MKGEVTNLSLSFPLSLPPFPLSLIPSLPLPHPPPPSCSFSFSLFFSVLFLCCSQAPGVTEFRSNILVGPAQRAPSSQQTQSTVSHLFSPSVVQDALVKGEKMSSHSSSSQVPSPTPSKLESSKPSVSCTFVFPLVRQGVNGPWGSLDNFWRKGFLDPSTLQLQLHPVVCNFCLKLLCSVPTNCSFVLLSERMYRS